MGAASLVSPSGEIKMWPTATAPTGFLLCTGAAVSRTIYAALFAVIGTTFGAGDGTTTFNLPDFDNRFAVGAGDLYAVGATGGSKDAILVSHTHTDAGHTHTTHTDLYGSSGISAGGNDINVGGIDPTGTGYASLSTEGESGTNKNLPPYLSVYFIIKT
jgi:microcystin-dependent protein